jgi:hypothetical protein
MKVLIFMVAGFAGGAYLASQFYGGNKWALAGGAIGAFVGWVFSGVGQKR